MSSYYIKAQQLQRQHPDWTWSRCCSELGKRGAKARARRQGLVRSEIRNQEARGLR